MGARGNVVGLATRLWAGQSMVRFLVGARKDVFLLQNSQPSSRAHPTSYHDSTVFLFWGWSGQGMMVTTHLHLVPVCFHGIYRDFTFTLQTDTQDLCNCWCFILRSLYLSGLQALKSINMFFEWGASSCHLFSCVS